MDWTQFTFIGATVVAMLVKTLWFKDDTTKRDKVIPIVAFVANFLIRLTTELKGGGGEVFGIDSVSTVMLGAAFWEGGIGSMLKVVGFGAYDTLLSWGLHRAKKYRDVLFAPKPKPVRRKR